jgi:hypothetical protein
MKLIAMIASLLLTIACAVVAAWVIRRGEDDEDARRKEWMQ